MFHWLVTILVILILPNLATAAPRGDVYRHAKAATALIVAVNDATESVSLGSGFFVNANGLLITNAHVIEESQRLYVYVRDRAVYSAPEVVAVDPDLDLAALRIRQTRVEALALSADIPAEGTEMVTVGYPRIQDILQMGFTLHPTISTGTVGGVAEGRSRANGRPVTFIQTTGILNFGNSGGPLVCADSGEVAGMLVQTVPYLERARDRSGAAIGSVTMKSGIGYSIPAPVIRQWLASNSLVLEPTLPSSVATSRRDAEPDATRSFATGHLLHTIAIVLHEDSDVINLALRHYEAAAALRPDAPWITRNLGLAYAGLGRWNRALEAYGKALELTPEDPTLLTDAGLAWQRTGRQEQAAECYRAAIRMNPRFWQAHNNLGTLLLEMGRSDDAIQEFRWALDGEPTSATAAYNLGLALEARGLRQEAIRIWESFLGAARSMPDADGLLSKMQEKVAKFKAATAGARSAVPVSHPTN
ncbi:MAG: serine protease [Nitrospirae bacterium]|nr:serine protease [Nitrospirota bacterium]